MRAVEKKAREVDQRLAEVESLSDPQAQGAAVGAVRALLELYGEGLDRMMATAYAADPSLPTQFAADPFVRHLLLMHDLHPVPVEERVLAALDEVRPYLASHGGNVELLGVEDGVVRLRMQGSCHGCPSSAVTLKTAIEEAIAKAAPDILSIDAGEADAAQHAGPELVSLGLARAAQPG